MRASHPNGGRREEADAGSTLAAAGAPSSGSGGDPVRVLIVDDHALFRRGLRHVLELEPDIVVAGEAEDGQQAIEAARELSPDVVLMDLRMPRRTGIEATEQIKEFLPKVAILILTISEEERDMVEAIKAGASGYLLKELSVDDLADAVRAVASGQSR